jgi:glycosyltransferase involved in cell wall biosynthesis
MCGVSRYARELTSALAHIDRDNEYLVYTNDVVHGFDLPHNFQLVATRCSRMNPAHDPRLARRLRHDRPDVYHALHAWLPVVFPAAIPALFTLHDVFAVTDPEFFAKRRPFGGFAREYFRWLIRRSISRARVVVTDSSFSQREIRRLFPASTTPVTVVHLAPCDPLPAASPSPQPDLAAPYVLYVGNFRSYKNVPTLLEAFARVRQAGLADVTLVLAGADSGEQVRSLVAELSIAPAVRFVHRPSDDALHQLYANASVLVQPSLYEGFGLPPLEAMRAGVPVIVSDAECLTEVCGEAARVFPRENVEALAAELRTVLVSADLADHLRHAGRVRAAQFTWTATARRVLAIYQAVTTGVPLPERL